jgi:hypothetical protein
VIESAVEFEYEVEPTNMNERLTTKHVSIDRAKIVDNSKSASQITEEICKEHGKDKDEKFKQKLEVRVIWSRYVTDQNKLKSALTS